MIPLPSLATVRLGALVAAIVGAGVAGWTVRGWKEDAARLDDERAAVENMRRIAGIYGQALDEANAARDTDRQQAAADRQDFDRRLRNATRPQSKPLVVCGPGLRADGLADHRPAVRFDPDFVRLWNDGLAIGLPAALRADGGDGRGSVADTAAR